jgi:hypothetical protein
MHDRAVRQHSHNLPGHPGSPRSGRPRNAITVKTPEYVDLSDTDRDRAIAVLTDILAAWWQRHRGADDDDIHSITRCPSHPQGDNQASRSPRQRLPSSDKF